MIKFRYFVIAIVLASVSAVVFERITRVECYSVNYNKVECVNDKTGEKWIEKPVNH